MDSATIGVQLERQRLEHRAHRIEHVLRALRERSVHRRTPSGGVPRPLTEAIAGFDVELRRVRRRLEAMPGR
jgi:hypothetical protein